MHGQQNIKFNYELFCKTEFANESCWLIIAQYSNEKLMYRFHHSVTGTDIAATCYEK